MEFEHGHGFRPQGCQWRFIARNIDRLTEHWDAESVPRAVASEAPEVGHWRRPRSLPLAVLIRRGLTSPTSRTMKAS